VRRASLPLGRTHRDPVGPDHVHSRPPRSDCSCGCCCSYNDRRSATTRLPPAVQGGPACLVHARSRSRASRLQQPCGTYTPRDSGLASMEMLRRSKARLLHGEVRLEATEPVARRPRPVAALERVAQKIAEPGEHGHRLPRTVLDQHADRMQRVEQKVRLQLGRQHGMRCRGIGVARSAARTTSRWWRRPSARARSHTAQYVRRQERIATALPGLRM